jgi:GT2 family glycosyltransferase
MSTVAAVIPHWNRADLLPPLLENLRQQTRPFDHIVIVDNGSTDNSASLAQQLQADVLSLPHNLGFAAAVNRGIQHAADATHIAILNNDVTLDPRWLQHLLAADTPFATGKILSARDPKIIDGTWDEISRAACALRCGAGSPDAPIWNTRRPIAMTSMTACLIRRDVFDRIGLLDERFVSYLEDVDFGLRCVRAGLSGTYEPRAVAHHLGSSTWGKWNPDTVRKLSRNQVLLIAKHFRGQPRWPILAGQLLWGGVALRHGCAWAWLQGKLGSLGIARSVEGAPAQRQFSEFLNNSEGQILSIQQQTGWETYWRVYSWLSPLR